MVYPVTQCTVWRSHRWYIFTTHGQYDSIEPRSSALQLYVLYYSHGSGSIVSAVLPMRMFWARICMSREILMPKLKHQDIASWDQLEKEEKGEGRGRVLDIAWSRVELVQLTRDLPCHVNVLLRSNYGNKGLLLVFFASYVSHISVSSASWHQPMSFPRVWNSKTECFSSI